MHAPLAAAVTAACLASAAWAGLTPKTPGPDSALITLTKQAGPNTFKSIYEITFLGVTGTTWTYEVAEISRQDLSHWVLGIENCLDHITSFAPSGAETGTDGSTGFTGIKWNTPDSFSSGQFSFTLDNQYAVSTVEVLAFSAGSYDTATIAGPDCDCLLIPEPMSLGLGTLGLVMLSLRRR